MRHELKRAAQNLRKKGPFLRGLLGDFDGNLEVTERPGYYYVRVEKPGGYEVGMFPGRVRVLYNLPVRIETHPITGVQYIAGTDDQTLTYSGVDPEDVPNVERHASTHEWGGDDMPMWLHTDQLFPLRCQPHPTITTSVVIQRGTYYAGGAFHALAATLTVDLSSYVPVAGTKYVLLYLDASGAAAVVDNSAAWLDALALPPGGTCWLAAVRLQAGEGIGWQDIIDLRFVNGGMSDGGVVIIEDGIVLNISGYPAASGEWTGLFAENIDGQGFLGLRATWDSDSGFFGLLDQGSDRKDTVIVVGDNTDDNFGIYHHQYTDGSIVNIFEMDYQGNVTLPSGATVDGVDVSTHDHSGAGEGGTVVFPSLGDTPSSYVGQGGKVVGVRADELGLEFTTGGSGGGGDAAILGVHVPWWTVDGPLAVLDEAGGVWRLSENIELELVLLYVYNTGSAGADTVVDVDVSSDGGAAWSTIFTTTANRPAVAGGATDKRAASAPDTVLVYAGDLLRLNIDNVATGARGLAVQVQGVIHEMTPTIYNITLTVADTEYSQAIAAGLRALSFKARTSVAVRWAFETGKVATPTAPYETLQAGQTYFKENIVGAAVTLYLASSTAGTVVEVEAWA